MIFKFNRVYDQPMLVDTFSNTRITFSTTVEAILIIIIIG